MIAEALALCDHSGEKYSLPELHRVKGDLLLRRGDGKPNNYLAATTSARLEAAPPAVDQAHACFAKALDIAQQQQTKSWELRALLSLASLHQQGGKQKKFQQMLQNAYSCFTEGHETEDLQRAQIFLDAASQPPINKLARSKQA